MHARLRRGAAAAVATGALVAGSLLAPADAKPGNGQANGHGKGHCRAFHAFGVGTDNGDVDGDGDGDSTATIYRGKREFATSTGEFTPGATVDGVLSFSGTIVFTNDHGTLSAPVEGTFDTITGEFASHSDSVTGTDDYANVTGKLRIWGDQSLSDGAFTEKVRARLCVPKKKQH
jgi:hypothetical protein